MDPVKIDFLIGGNTDQEGEKVVQTMDDITDASKKAQDSFRKSIADQRAVVKQIEKDITDLEKKLSQATPGRAKQSALLDLNAAKKALDEEKGALAGLEVQVESTAQKHTRLRTQVMDAKEALDRMAESGLRGTEAYKAQQKTLGELHDRMQDATQQARVMGDDEKYFKATTQAVSGLAGAFTAGVGAVSLFGSENEDLVKIQTRLQSVMAITIGLQQVAETLNKDNYVSILFLSKAKQGWASAQAILNTQLGIGVGLSKALMISGIGLLIAGIGALVVLYQNWSKKQEEINRLKEEFQDIEKGAVKEMANEKVAAEQLLKVAGDHTKSIDIRRQAVERLNKLMPDYNGYLNREGELVGNADTALKNYLLSLYKVEKAKKLIAGIEEDTSNVDTLTQQGSKPNGFFKEMRISYNRMFGANNFADQLERENSVEWAKQIGNIQKNKAAKEAELQKLLGDPNVFNSVFGSPEKAAGSGGSSSPTAAAEAKEAYDAEKELREKLVAIRAQTTKLQIDQMQDGLQKRLAEIEAAKEEEIGKIEKTQQEIVDAYNKSHEKEQGFTEAIKIEDVPGVKPETLQAYEDEKTKITTAAEAARKQATEEANREIIRLANSYAEERVQIAGSYADDIAKLEASGQTGAASAARAERDKRISEATAEMIMSTDLYKTASDEKLQVSALTTARLIEDIKKRIAAEVAAGNLSKEKAREMLDELNKTGVSRTENDNRNNPFAKLLDGLEKYKAAKKDLANARESGASTDDLAKLEDASNSALKATAGAAGAALQGVQAILGSVVDGLDQLGMLTEEEKETANQVIGMVGGAADIAMGIASGNPVQIIQGSIALIVNGMKLFDKKSRDIEKSQKKHLQQVTNLEIAYKKLQRDVENALGTDVYKSQREAIENMKKQIKEYEGWLADEAKKKKKKQDKDKIAETKAKIEELKNSMEDEAKAIAEALAQTDAKSLAGELADAITTAFTEGEDAALAFGEVAEQVMQNAVKNALKLHFLENPMQNAVDQLAKDMESGGQLTDAEQAAFRKKIEDAGKLYYEQLAQYSDLFSKSDTGVAEDSAAKGMQGEVKNISEETGLKLTGAINAMRLNVDEIVRNNRSGIDLMGRQLAELEAIKSNTSFCRKLERMDETLYDLKVNGIKVK